MFVIMIPVKDIVTNQLFGDKNFNNSKLIEQLTEYYTYGIYKPEVHLDGDMVFIEVPDELIIKDEKKYNKVVSLCDNGRFIEALPIIKKLVEDTPTVSEYSRLYGQILSIMGKQEEAIKHLKNAIKWDYTNKWAFIMLGNIYGKHQNDLDKAMMCYNRALIIEPENNILLNNMGANLAAQGRLIEAREHLERAKDIDPEYPNTHYGLAMLDSINNDHYAAFINCVSCMKLCKAKDELYNQALSMGMNVASVILKASEHMDSINKLIDQIYMETGKKTTISTDASLTTAAKVKIAENYGSDHHEVFYNPQYPAYQHLIMHELMHVEFANRARKLCRNKLYITNNQMQELFIRDNRNTIEKLVSKNYPESQVAEFIREFYKGLNMQLFNTNIDILIEDEIFSEYPELRPLQMLSLYTIVKAGLDSVNSKKAIALSPKKHISNSRILNTLIAKNYESLYGVKFFDEFNCDYDERKKHNLLYNNYLQAKNNFTPGDEYDLIDQTAKALHLENYYKLVPEEDFKAEKEKSKPIENKQSTSTRNLNMAVVMYMTTALNYLIDADRDEIRNVAYEIAELGKKGIDMDSPELNYTLDTIPDKQFTGLQLTAWMYIAWQMIDPQINTGLDYENEYETAMQMIMIKK